MNKDIVALGELLIDFTDNGTSSQGNPVMEANPGGAPCNVLAMLTKLGRSTAFIGKVGDDMFGKQLTKALNEVGIGTEGLVKDNKIHTTLAFVHTFPGGDRDFSFYRNPGADMMLSEDEVDEELIRNARIFHFGSLSMTAEPAKSATVKALRIAKEAGAIISFDPNLREPLWDSLDDAKREIAYGMSQCDILKISDNEITWFTGKEEYDYAVMVLQKMYPNIKLILLSLGAEGSRCYQNGLRVIATAFRQADTIETTGAGDTFCAGVLHYVLEHGLREYSEDEMGDMLTFANAAASIITTRKGALRVMPSKEEVEELIASTKKYKQKQTFYFA
jgi:fructokinase